ncbi:hypothetical protein JCM11491_001876 [Sporobolomyces phaffii]
MLSQERAENRDRKTKSSTRSRYTAKSCNNCRKRKAKCDGVQPSCSTCTLYKDTCVWSDQGDQRRAPKKGEIAALRERIKVLEGLLARKEDGQGLDEAVRVRTKVLDSDQEDTETENDGMSGALDEQTLELTAYGPTSAFQHLPPPDPGASPLDANNFSPSPIPSSSQSDTTSGAPIYWNKFLPQLEGWDEALHDDLVDVFFLFFNSWCCWVEEDSFRTALQSVLSFDSTLSTSRTSHYSPLLHLTLLAVATSYSDDPRASQAASLALVTNAKAFLDEEGERPTIATLRGLLLLGSWHSGNALQGLGNVYSGIAFRMCRTLGLGIDSRAFVRSGLLSEPLQRTRDYAMWTAFIQDKLWSSYVGRNPTLLLNTLDTPAPYVDDELDSRLWKPLAGSQRRTPALSHLTSCFRWLTTLAVLQERTLATLYGLRTNVKAASTLNLVSELNLKLESWMSKLPDQLRIPPQLTKPPPSHVILLNALYHFITILLYRPYYNHSDHLPINDVSVKRCNAASSRIISLFELFEAAPGLRYAPVTLVQIAFAAGTTQLLSSVNSNGKKAQESREAAQRCVVALKEIGKAWKCGSQTAGILQRLVEEWAPLKDSPPSQTTEPIPIPTEGSARLAPGLEAELLRLGWKPPNAEQMNPPSLPSTQPPAPVVDYDLPQPPPIFASPPSNPLSLQNGFASAFSHPFPPHQYPLPFPSHPHYPPQYDATTSWFPQASTSATAEPLPDDVFAAMLSYAGRDAMQSGDTGLGGTASQDWQF